MIVEELLNKVENISKETNYWFVRTDYGEYFDTFYENGFIGIGWNEISIEELKNTGLKVSVKEKIGKAEELDYDKTSTKGTITAIYNKLNRFINLKKGDIVIIPSRKSSRYAFGIIQDNEAYSVYQDENNCKHVKRKKVKWINIKPVKLLNPVFQQIKISRHSISQINDYSEYIDNEISNIYLKEGNAHFVLNITTEKDINVESLIELIKNIQKLSKDINTHFHLNESIHDNSIRLNLQSPGNIEFKLPIGKTLVTLSAILALSCNNHNAPINNELTTFANIHSDTLNKINQSMIDLEVDREKINSIK
jgi:restriction system protein